MALASTTVWSCNASSTAANACGGGFNPANANMLTDLAATSATGSSPVVTSATYTFVAGDVGAWVYVKTGTNWTPGWYQIASVNAGAATLTAGIGTASQPAAVTGIPTLNTVAGCATTASPTGGTFSIDYSLGTIAIVARLDFSCTTSSTTLTAGGSSFTPVMVGNIFHLTTTGTGAHGVIGYYEVVSYTSGTQVVLDRTCQDGGATSMTAATGRVGGAISLGSSTASLTDQIFFQTMSGGMIVRVKTGTYSVQGTSSLTAATANPVWVIGYNTTPGDNPIYSNLSQPVFAMGTNTITWGANWTVQYLTFTGTASAMVTGGNGTRFDYCKFVNSSTTANRSGLSAGTGAILSYCEFVSYRGTGLNLGGNSGVQVFGCYAHASDVGIKSTGATNAVSIRSSIIEGCVTAAYQSTGAATGGAMLASNSIIGFVTPVGIGVSLATGTTIFELINNIIYGFTTGISHADNQTIGEDNFNDYFNNTNDVSAAAQWQKGPNDLAVDPSFASLTQVSNIGTVSTNGAGTTLTDTGQDFTTAGVVAGRDYVYISGGTGATVGICGISAVGTTTLTLDVSAGASASSVTYQILIGHNWAIGASALKTGGTPGAFIGAPNGTTLTTGYQFIGAVGPQQSGGGSAILAGEGIGLVIT